MTTLGGGKWGKTLGVEWVGGTQQSFIRGGSTLSSKPLPYYIPFLTEKVTLSWSYIFIKNGTPFSYL